MILISGKFSWLEREDNRAAVVSVMFMLVGCVGVERGQSTEQPDRGQDRTHCITTVSSL